MRAALLALGGALLAVVVAVVGAWAFLRWRATEQERALEGHAEGCYAGKQDLCDRLLAACEKHSGVACAKLAARYLKGKGVTIDLEEGLRLLDEGCRAHHAESCFLSAARRSGENREPEKAAEALRKACSMGLKAACTPSTAR